MMGSILMYELLAEERATQYRAEAERDRRLAMIAAQRRRAVEAAPVSAGRTSRSSEPSVPSPRAATPNPAGTRRALGAAFLGLAAIGALRRRKIIASR